MGFRIGSQSDNKDGVSGGASAGESGGTSGEASCMASEAIAQGTVRLFTKN